MHTFHCLKSDDHRTILIAVSMKLETLAIAAFFYSEGQPSNLIEMYDTETQKRFKVKLPEDVKETKTFIRGINVPIEIEAMLDETL